MPSSEMLRRVALVRTDVSAKRITSIIKVTRIGELGTLAVTSNRSTLRRVLQSPATTNNVSSSPIVVTLMMEAMRSDETSGCYKSHFLQESHGVTSQKTAFLTVTAVKTSNLT
jgi:hypothetical protein